MSEMSLVAFLKHVGLFVAGQDKAADLRALTEEDRAWFAQRAKVEYGITIVRPQAQ